MEYLPEHITQLMSAGHHKKIRLCSEHDKQAEIQCGYTRIAGNYTVQWRLSSGH